MFRRSDLAKLELILKYINDMQVIIGKHGTIENTLSDTEGEYAIMMCITQIGEVVNKIEDENILTELPASKIIGLRNRIVHGYEDIDNKIISETIKIHIPSLKKVIESLLGNIK
jgi:uncharacterized protein with HEPN domain